MRKTSRMSKQAMGRRRLSDPCDEDPSTKVASQPSVQEIRMTLKRGSSVKTKRGTQAQRMPISRNAREPSTVFPEPNVLKRIVP